MLSYWLKISLIKDSAQLAVNGLDITFALYYLEGLQAAQAVNATEARAEQIAKLKVDIRRRKAKYGY